MIESLLHELSAFAAVLIQVLGAFALCAAVGTGLPLVLWWAYMQANRDMDK